MALSLGILLAALWFAALVLCLQLFLIRKPAGSTSRRAKPRRRSRQVKHVPLANELTRLLNGDRLTAQRLVASTRRRHPGRAEQWYWEKTIHDLERDRR